MRHSTFPHASNGLVAHWYAAFLAKSAVNEHDLASEVLPCQPVHLQQAFMNSKHCWGCSWAQCSRSARMPLGMSLQRLATFGNQLIVQVDAYSSFPFHQQRSEFVIRSLCTVFIQLIYELWAHVTPPAPVLVRMQIRAEHGFCPKSLECQSKSPWITLLKNRGSKPFKPCAMHHATNPKTKQSGIALRHDVRHSILNVVWHWSTRTSDWNGCTHLIPELNSYATGLERMACP